MRAVDPAPDAPRPHAAGSRTQRDPRPAGARHLADRALVGIVDVSDGWDAAARCRGEDATLFFGPNRFEPKQERLEREAEAKAVCAQCPVLASCREHSLKTAELYGVWGGLGEADRRALLGDRAGVARAV